VNELCAIALEAIRRRLAQEPDRAPALTSTLAEPGAAFVTLERDERLLGCVGSLEAVRPLGADVARHAVAAAFADPRVPPITVADYEQMSCKVAVLSPMTPLAVDSFAALTRALRPNVDGLVVASGKQRATFLPSVWAKVPDIAAFLDELWRKAALVSGTWPTGIQCSTYTTDEYAAAGPRPFR